MGMGHTLYPTLLPWRELTLLWWNIMVTRTLAGKIMKIENILYSMDCEIHKHYWHFAHCFSLSNFQVLPTNDANKLNVLDPVLKAGVCAQTHQTFTIGCNKSGEIPQSVAVMTPNGKDNIMKKQYPSCQHFLWSTSGLSFLLFTCSLLGLA